MSNRGIYHNGLTAQPFDCDLVLHETSIYLYLHDQERSLLIWSFGSIQSCHLNGSTLIVKNGSYPHETLECSGEIARSIYAAWSKNSLVRKAEGWVFAKRTGPIITLCVSFLVLCLLFYFFVLPWAGEKAAALVPVSAEVEMGRQINETFLQQVTVNDSATYWVNCFIKQLSLDSTYPLHAEVVESPEINAFALPGGNMVIYTGILNKMDSYEELAALLGHEVTHVTHRHSLKSIFRTLASSLIIASLFGDITGVSSAVISEADRFKQLNYSRELETEADINGLNLMVRNHISPSGMLDLLQLLKKEGTEMPGLMKYLSTHPDTDARIQNVEVQPESKLEFPEDGRLKEIFRGVKRGVR